MGTPDPQRGATVEFELGDLRDHPPGDTSNQRHHLPGAPSDLRHHLPGLEPDRQVTDWGRSERIEALVDKTIYGFLYHYWFRVEVEGIENVPGENGALLVANHAGALPSDGAMIAKAIREQHPRRRPVHFATERELKRLPGLGTLMTKVGGVGAHPADVHRLLFDERQLVLVFPEGRAAARKPISKRYRLESFHPGSFTDWAMRARATIVPVAVLGAEEAAPMLASLNPVSRLTGLPRLPVIPLAPLPAKFRIRFLEPVYTEDLGRAPWKNSALVRAITEDIRALLQENLLEMVAGRRSVWLG